MSRKTTGVLTCNSFFAGRTVKNIHHAYVELRQNCRGKCASTSPELRYLCSSCKKTKRLMCKGYHDRRSVVEELERRLEYEVLFGMVAMNDLVSGKWTEACGRDEGHHTCIKELVVACAKRKLLKDNSRY